MRSGDFEDLRVYPLAEELADTVGVIFSSCSLSLCRRRCSRCCMGARSWASSINSPFSESTMVRESCFLVHEHGG
jgi:lysophospholipid acyltransferase (LPLAT)-like uncharacterized protein